MEYVVVLVILILGVLIFGGKPYSKVSDSWLVIEWLVIVLLAGLRYKVGGDTQTYFSDYISWPNLKELRQLPNLSEFGRYNILWVYFVSLFKTISNDFVYLQIAHSLIVNTTFFVFFRKRSRNVFFVILIFYILFFFWYNTEVLRAAISVSIFLWSFKDLEDRNWARYYFFCLLALGFHSESFILFLFPFLVRYKNLVISRKHLLFIFLISVALLFVNFLPLFHNIFSSSDKLSSNIDYYANQSRLGSGVSILGYIKVFLWNLIWLYACLINRNDAQGIFTPFVVLHFLISIVMINYSNIFLRMMDFTKPLAILSVGESFCILRNKHDTTKCVVLLFMIALLLYDEIVYLADGHYLLFYPYSSIFNPVDYPARELFYYEIFN